MIAVLICGLILYLIIKLFLLGPSMVIAVIASLFVAAIMLSEYR
jgi:hypothetical protein